MILGLTGGIASGKSTATKILKEIGYEIYDADLIAHEVLKDRDCVNKIVEEFGNSILTKNIEIDRKVLREIVFRDKNRLKKLNSIVHPMVIEVFKKIKDNHKKIDSTSRKEKIIKKEIIIFDIPLLFEVKLEYLCDKIILVYTDRETQIKRIRERDGSSQELAEKMIDSQESLESKKMKSDYCIDNSKDIEHLKNEIVTILEKIQILY